MSFHTRTSTCELWSALHSGGRNGGTRRGTQIGGVCSPLGEARNPGFLRRKPLVRNRGRRLQLVAWSGLGLEQSLADGAAPSAALRDPNRPQLGESGRERPPSKGGLVPHGPSKGGRSRPDGVGKVCGRFVARGSRGVRRACPRRSLRLAVCFRQSPLPSLSLRRREG